MTTGIYEIHSNINNSSYIGSSVNTEKRWSKHQSRLRGNYHPNHHLQHAWNKYGENAFQFRILMICSNPQDLLIVEQTFIDSNCPEYNMKPAIGGPLSDEIRHKISATLKGRPLSAETKRKIGLAHKGKSKGPFTEEHRRNLSKALIGIKRSDEFKRKRGLIMMGNQNLLGHKHTEEAKAKMSLARIGNKYGIGNKNFLNHKHTLETRAKMSLAARKRKKQPMAGKKHSAETKIKMSQAQLKRRQREQELL